MHQILSMLDTGSIRHIIYPGREWRMTNGQLPTLALEGNRPAVSFLSRFKGCFQCWNANCGYCRMFAFNVGLFDASCSQQLAPPTLAPTFAPYWPIRLLPTLDPIFDASCTHTLTRLHWTMASFSHAAFAFHSYSDVNLVLDERGGRPRSPDFGGPAFSQKKLLQRSPLTGKSRSHFYGC